MLTRLIIGLAFILVPMLELVLLIKIGQSIGAWATVGLVIATAAVGIFILSRQSLTVVSRTMEALSEGRPPVVPVTDGLFLLVAGALLLTPGLLTDVAALALLVPPLRRAIARAAMRWAMRRTEVHVRGHASADGRGEDKWRDAPVIEGEFERLDERPLNEPGVPPRNGRRPPGT